MSTIELTPPTQNFRIFYDPSLPNALANVLQFARSVEFDFQTLTNWFGVTDGFGPNNRTNVNLIYQGNHGSDNHGYHGDGSTTLNLNGAPSVAATAIADTIRMHFVAEFSEVLMDYNNQHGPTTWVAGQSHGEGLSLYCAYTLAPNGYNAFYGPGFENNWLSSNRVSNDWVNNTEQTDKDSLSYGCALLYLFYLQSQLDFSTVQIIQNGGSTLAQTYNKLAGAGDAFNPFRSLLDQFYPPGQAGGQYLQVVNPFPLLTAVGRRVDITATNNDVGNPVLVAIGDAVMKPFFNCPEKDYKFGIWGQPYQLSIAAKTHGFGSASFNWYLNGLVMTGNAGTITVPISLTEQNPNAVGGGSSRDTTIQINWQITAQGNTNSTMLLSCQGPFGIYDLNVRVDATEVFATGAPGATNTDFEIISDAQVKWEAQYYKDRAACEKPFIDVASRYVRYHPYLNLLLVAPDPPEQYQRAVQFLKNIARELESLKDTPAEVHKGIDKVLRSQLGVSSAALHALLTHKEQLEGERGAAAS
jgi:hypothetical protein